MPELEQAYQFCQKLAKSHYENFPVASVLLPKRLRRPISVIYAFARTADDFADEGDLLPQQRLARLEEFSTALQAVSDNTYQDTDPIFIALADVIKQHALPTELFVDLLDAFKQDVIKQRYQSFADVLDYCRRSANPVGRLLLHLSGKPTPQQLEQSDAICSSLQLINFYQDIVQDLAESNRVYIPTDELEQFGVGEQQLLSEDTTKIAPLLHLQYQRAQHMMTQGIELGCTLRGRIGWEIRAMTLGGIITLNKLIKQKDHVLLSRPRLTKLTLLQTIVFSLSKKQYLRHAKQLLDIP